MAMNPPPSARLPVKVVPGSSRDQIVGWLGDASKIKVMAPPENGRANEAVVSLLSERLRLSAEAVTKVFGLLEPIHSVRQHASGCDCEKQFCPVMAARMGVEGVMDEAEYWAAEIRIKRTVNWMKGLGGFFIGVSAIVSGLNNAEVFRRQQVLFEATEQKEWARRLFDEPFPIYDGIAKGGLPIESRTKPPGSSKESRLHSGVGGEGEPIGRTTSSG